MNRFTQIFNTPYVPKYGSMPISEVGKIMQQRKQSMDNAVLQDMQTMSAYNKTMSMLDEDERSALNQAIGQPLIDVKARIESGDYNIRDIALQPKKDAITIVGLVQTAQALAQQRQEDYENFIELNKDADPEQVAEVASQNRAKIQLGDDGYLTLSGGLGDTKLPEFVPPEERMAVEPLQFETPVYEALRNFGTKKIPTESPGAGINSVLVSRFGAERAPVVLKAATIEEAIDMQGEYKPLFEKVASSIDFSGDFDQDKAMLEAAVKKYFENTKQLEGITARELDIDEYKKVRDKFIKNDGMVNYSIFVPEDNWRGDYSEFKRKYGIEDLEKTDIAIRGAINDPTGLYAIGGSGYVGSFIGDKKETKQFIIDSERPAEARRLEPIRNLLNPLYMKDVNKIIKDNKTGRPVNATISKNISFYSNGNEVSGDNPYAVPRITYNVTVPGQGTKELTFEQVYNQFFETE